MKQISLIFSLLAVISCGSVNSSKDIKTQDSNDNNDENSVMVDIPDGESTTKVKFKDFNLIIDSTYFWIEMEDYLERTFKDTAFLYLELGDDLTGKPIFIESQIEASFEITQSYQNSMAISAEGPHCDLINWKHYDAPWKPLDKIGQHQYRSLGYSADWNTFPEVTIDEAKKAVKEHCDADWYNVVKDATDVKDYPFYLATNQVTFRISVTPSNQPSYECVLIVYTPMGC